eukprot:Awhi_evm1s3840
MNTSTQQQQHDFIIKIIFSSFTCYCLFIYLPGFLSLILSGCVSFLFLNYDLPIPKVLTLPTSSTEKDVEVNPDRNRLTEENASNVPLQKGLLFEKIKNDKEVSYTIKDLHTDKEKNKSDMKNEDTKSESYIFDSGQSNGNNDDGDVSKDDCDIYSPDDYNGSNDGKDGKGKDSLIADKFNNDKREDNNNNDKDVEHSVANNNNLNTENDYKAEIHGVEGEENKGEEDSVANDIGIVVKNDIDDNTVEGIEISNYNVNEKNVNTNSSETDNGKIVSEPISTSNQSTLEAGIVHSFCSC